MCCVLSNSIKNLKVLILKSPMTTLFFQKLLYALNCLIKSFSVIAIK